MAKATIEIVDNGDTTNVTVTMDPPVSAGATNDDLTPAQVLAMQILQFVASDHDMTSFSDDDDAGEG